MKCAIYAGSFDPWTSGHQFVLDSALQTFDCVHVLCSVNPTKQTVLTVDERIRVIAHALDPLTDWSNQTPPFFLEKRKVVIASSAGLVVNYAKEKKIGHLIRGLRSSSDFEAEFLLYLANHALFPDLQTWAILCPPRLLHCSSTYVRTVAGHPHVDSAGASFLAQALLIRCNPFIGRLFDLLALCAGHTPRLQNLFLWAANQSLPRPTSSHDFTAASFRLQMLLKDNENQIKDGQINLAGELLAILSMALEDNEPKGADAEKQKENLLPPKRQTQDMPPHFFPKKEIFDFYQQLKEAN